MILCVTLNKLLNLLHLLVSSLCNADNGFPSHRVVSVKPNDSIIPRQSDAMDTIHYCQFCFCFCLVKRLGNAEWLFQEHCPGYAMSVITSTNMLYIPCSFFSCKHLSKPQKKSFGKDKMQAEILQICTDGGETRIKSKTISILKYFGRAHVYQKRIKY